MRKSIAFIKFETRRYNRYVKTLFLPNKMPTKNDPEIVLLRLDLENGSLRPTLTAKELLEARPELREKYKDEVGNFARYWNRMRKHYGTLFMFPGRHHVFLYGLSLPCYDHAYSFFHLNMQWIGLKVNKIPPLFSQNHPLFAPRPWA